jgi:S1-C subfamily serine protease
MNRWVNSLIIGAVLLLPSPTFAEPPQLNIRTAEMKDGLTVTAVASDGLGKQMNLKEKDILVTVNGRTTGTSKELRDALAQVDKDVEIVLLRSGQRQTVKGKLQPSNRGQGKFLFLPDKR